MSNVTELVCVCCNRSYLPDQIAYTCESCGPETGILDVRYEMPAVKRTLTWGNLHGRSHNHWRYRELLPVDEIPTWAVGWTPIISAPRLTADLGVRSLRLKDEGRNPTASLKDRASSLAVARVLEAADAAAIDADATTIACASTGNAASSLAGFAALAGIPAVIFVPKSAPEPKIAQLLVYGAMVFRVHGTYAEAYELCMAA